MERSDLAMIAEGLERILAEAPLDAIDHAGGLGAGADALWATLSDNGYTRLCASEAHGGFGGSPGDAAALARLAGRHALAAPLADTVLATGLLSAAGCAAPEGRLALADPLDPAMPLAHAAQGEAALMLSDGALRLVAISACDLVPVSASEDGAARVMHWPTTSIIQARAPDWLTPTAFHALAAFIRAASMAGAMEAVLDLTLTYTAQREQFGRPLARFQAIQHHLADIACETAAASAAVELAADALAADPRCSAATLDEIAIAKLRCGEAATRVAAAAHQAHGAMGFTREYKLGRYTRRLWQWQDAFGTAEHWAERLGSGILAAPVPALWPAISR